MKKYYILCPHNVISGGPETLHTFVSTINDLGYEGYIVYTNRKMTPINEYSMYNIKVIDKIDDNENNVLFVPEVLTDYLFKYKKIKKVIIFLSVKFYENSRFDYIKENYKNKYKLLCLPSIILKVFLKLKKAGFNSKKIDFANQDFFYTVNGEINRQYLKKLGVMDERIYHLCGPLNVEFFKQNESINKEDIIVYNPKKGYEFTKQIIDSFNQKFNYAKFIKIENMKPNEVHNLLKRAKLYIDFGFHPGPERIPREAVISRCNIITSNLGSASNDIDIPIPRKYKFSCDKQNVDQIVDLMNAMLKNYSLYINDFDEFRDKILKQPFEIIEDTKKILREI